MPHIWSFVQEEKGSLDGDGQERDALYEQAERLSNSLVTMGQQLRETVEVCSQLCIIPHPDVWQSRKSSALQVHHGHLDVGPLLLLQATRGDDCSPC